MPLQDSLNNMRPPDSVSDGEIRQAIGIYTIDPHDQQAAGHHLWGDRTEVSQVRQAKSDPNVLVIALPSDDHVSLLALIDRIKRLKRTLPPDVEVLRQNLGK